MIIANAKMLTKGCNSQATRTKMLARPIKKLIR
jgi:hypothetical protein